MTAHHTADLAFSECREASPKIVPIRGSQSQGFSEASGEFRMQGEKLRSRLNLEYEFYLPKAFDHILECYGHRIRPQFMCWHHDEHPFCLRNYVATELQESIAVGHICTCNNAWKNAGTGADMHFSAHHQGVNRRPRANQGSLISIHQQHRRMPILPAHHIYRDRQRGDRADRLNPSRPIGLRQLVLIAQQCDVNDAENCEECDREVGIFHLLAKSCSKGIIA
jgi:hypothetical protein